MDSSCSSASSTDSLCSSASSADTPSPPTSGLHHDSKRATHRAKRPLDSAEQVQTPQPAKKVCVLSHHCSTPPPPDSQPLYSLGTASGFLDDSSQRDLTASFSASKYNDVAISLHTTPCFDDSEPSDSLLEVLDGEERNSSGYPEEEIQGMLADECVESKQCPASTEGPNVNGESEKDKSSCSTRMSSLSEEAEKPNEALSTDCSLLSSDEDLNESPGVAENCLQSAPVTCVLFDLDVQELLRLSPIDADSVDQPLEDSCVEESGRETSEPVGYQEFDESAQSCVWLRHPTSPSGVGRRRLPKATKSWRSRKLDSVKDEERESVEAEQPSESPKLRDRTAGQEETASGMKPGEVIPVLQEEERERLKDLMCLSEGELEQKQQ